MAPASARLSTSQDRDFDPTASNNDGRDSDGALKEMGISRTPSHNIRSPTTEFSGQHVTSKEDDEGIERGSSSSEPLGGEDIEDEELGHMATRRSSMVSVAETLPLHRELLFVAIICLAQLFTRESHRMSCKERGMS